MRSPPATALDDTVSVGTVDGNGEGMEGLTYAAAPPWFLAAANSTCTRYTRLTLSTNSIKMKMKVICSFVSVLAFSVVAFWSAYLHSILDLSH